MKTFHLALPITDLSTARKFNGEVLGLEEKRSAFNWIDFDFFWHQLSLHLVVDRNFKIESTIIDGDQVPAHHFGLVLNKEDWESMKLDLQSKKIKFIIGPKIRFMNTPEEQGTFFISDPFGNYIEIKYFTKNPEKGWL